MNNEQPSQSLVQNDINTVLGHQLFSSLHTDLMLEYLDIHQCVYSEANTKAGVTFAYTKKIPLKGLLSITYSANYAHEKESASAEYIQVANQAYTLLDNQVVLLKLPLVNESSVVVKDVSGTIVYRLNIDYALIPLGNYLQIIRIAGSQIPDNGTVYLYYTANQPGNIQYDLASNFFTVNLAFFNQFVNVYYSEIKQNYFNVVNTNANDLNYLNNKIYGLRLAYKFATLGAEYNDYASSITPYKVIRYYAILQGTYQKYNFALNADSRDYLKLSIDSTHRFYENVTAMVAYNMNSTTRFDLNMGYQYQNGQYIDLSYGTFRLKMTKVVHGIIWSAGLDGYKRNYLINQKSEFLGAFVQALKKF
jgi:hypothetical protein